jgi:type II restriction/modification system DNA methylase subunit YeeA
MNKTAIKNFAIWARRKLISDITYKAGLLGINEKGISEPLPISTDNIQFFDIGTGKPTEIANDEIKQRKALVARIREKESSSDYKTAYQYVVEEVAYTWFNRLIAIRFMEVNDYLPSRVRVLSSHIDGKSEPDIVTKPFDTDMEFTAYEQDRIMQLKDENKLDELFRMLFIKQCNKLNEVLPGLFEKTSDYTELLLNISFTDQEGIVNHLINDIAEENFTEAVEIIGWLYQYYNEERKNEVINIYKGTVKKEDIPAATQLFTTDWVVRYMVDNSLGRYWIERNPQSKLQEKLEYFVTPKSGQIQYLNEKVSLEELTFFDPCMGSGHILVYAFDVLMEIYRESGYLDRDAAREIVEKNIFGLDIDDRAYQLAYFAVMMKARSYDRRFLKREVTPRVYPIYDYTDITNTENEELQYLIDEFKNVKQYGSLVNLKSDLDLVSVKNYLEQIQGQLSLDTVNLTKMENVVKVVELLINKYAVVCTNPPYLNKMNGELKNYIKKYYKDYSKDLFSVFMYKNFDYCKPNGYSAFMTPFVWMFIKTYEKLRTYIIENKSVTTLVQMEYSAFEEATVPICSFVLKNGDEKENGLYFKLSDFKGGMQVQKQKVLEALSDKECSYFYETSKDNFSKIPGVPIAYWVSKKMQEAFKSKETIASLAPPKQGLATADNDRFLRLWFEAAINNIGFGIKNCNEALQSNLKWFPYNKGGAFRRWYGNREYVVNWENDGFEIKNFRDVNGKVRSRPQNLQYYFKPAITWSDITSASFSGRYCESGFIFDIKGSSGFPKLDKIYYILGFLNSSISQKFVKILNPTITTQVGDMARIPVLFESQVNDKVDSLVQQNIQSSKIDWDSSETSWDFKKHLLLNDNTVQSAFEKLQKECDDRFNSIKSNEEVLNRIFIDIYGLQGELTPEVEDKYVTVNRIYDSKEAIPQSMKGSKYILTKLNVVKSFISYAVGCMLGRYSLDKEGLAFAGGQWDSKKYSSFIPDQDNCIPITDEEYFEDDIIGRFVEFVKVVYGKKTLEENLGFIAKALGGKGDTSREVIRNYFIKDFFKDHVKTYQKRPIYWLYDSGKQNGIKALVYMHRYNADTTGIVRVDYLHKMQKIYMSEIDRMQDMIENSLNAREVALAEKRKEKLIKQLKETKEYDEKIAHIALSRIAIDLDDGVKVNYEKVQMGQDTRKLNILSKI